MNFLIFFSFVFCCLITTLQWSVKGYRKFENPKEVNNFCLSKSHYIIDPENICCNTSVLQPGISIKNHWEKCAISGSLSSAVDAAWDVYACTIKTSNADGGTISLKKFAELMSTKYPEEIKNSIISEADTVGELSADVTNFKELDKLRTTYFDIEKEVCSGMSSETKNYGKVRSCEEWDESIHRGGRCCEKSSFPFDIGYNSLLDFTKKTEVCRDTIKKNVFSKFKVSWTLNMQSAILDICDLSCKLIQENKLEVKDILVEQVNVSNFINVEKNLRLSWMPSQVQQDATDFVMQSLSLNDTIEMMTKFSFQDAIDDNTTTSKILYFQPNYFPIEILHVPVICYTHKELLGLMEFFLYKSCSMKDKTSASTNTSPAPEE